MKKSIRVFIKEPGQDPCQSIVRNELEPLQKNVGGYIETLQIASDVVIICDEEGLLKNKPFNCEICGQWLFGTILIAGVNGEEFSDVPMSFQELKSLFPGLFEQKGVVV